MLRVRRGDFAMVAEIMVVASVPRQTVNRWLREERVDLARMRMRRLAKMHEAEERYLAGKPVMRKPTKRHLHRVANRAYEQWTKANGKHGKAHPGQS